MNDSKCKKCGRAIAAFELTGGCCKLCRSPETLPYLKGAWIMSIGVSMFLASLCIGAVMCFHGKPYYEFILHGPIGIVILTILVSIHSK